MRNMNIEDFDPEAMDEMSARLDAVARGEAEGYELVFFISENDAFDLLDSFDDAFRGDPKAQIKCWGEFAKIINKLREAVDSDITDH